MQHMLDIKFIRENKELVAMGAKKKHMEIDLDRLLTVDDKRKELQQSLDEKRSKQNAASEKFQVRCPLKSKSSLRRWVH